MKDLAEKVLLGIINAGYCGEPNELAEQAYDIAAAMQDEADKREVSIEELMKDHVHDYIYGRVCACGAVNGVEEEWQPDWSQAPEWAVAWTFDKKNVALWWSEIPETHKSIWFIDCGIRKCAYAPSFNYQGDWTNSLRKRPQ